MSNKLINFLLLVGIVVFAGAANAKSEDIERTFDLKAGGTLEIDSEQGAIKIETWNKDKVEVLVKKRARTDDRLKDFSVEFDDSPERLTIRGHGGWNARVEVKYIVKVPSNFNLNLNTGGGSISVEDISGIIELNTSGGSISIGDVAKGRVDAKTSGGSIKVGDVDGDLEVDTSGGSIRIGHVTGKALVDTSGGSITVKQGGKSVAADTSGGSIKIGPSDGNVVAETSGGSIRIGMAQGDVKADTSGGSVSVEGSKGKVYVESSGGSLFVGSSGGAVVADTAGGGITIRNAKGSIDAETSGGEIIAEMIETDNSKDTSVRLNSSGGDLTLYLPETIEATVSATLRISSYSHRDYRIYSDFPLTIQGEDSDRVTANGKINGGGDRIDLRTTNGDIHIKKLGSD